MKVKDAMKEELFDLIAKTLCNTYSRDIVKIKQGAEFLLFTDDTGIDYTIGVTKKVTPLEYGKDQVIQEWSFPLV